MTTTTTENRVGYLPQMITVQEAADFLHVNRRTVSKWIEDDRIPLSALISSLRGTYDLSAALRDAEQQVAAARAAAEPEEEELHETEGV